MSYATVEVELRDGRVFPSRGEALPSSARALLVVLETGVAAGKDDAGALSRALASIRAHQAARGHRPPSPDMVSDQLRTERESWS